MSDVEPEWVTRERKEQPGQIKHVEGEPMERCYVCGNYKPYCTCEKVES